MNDRVTAVLVAIAMLTTVMTAVVSPSAADSETNVPPTAQHSDRTEEDEDGDGEETVRFKDTQSEDPDYVHEDGNDLLCDLGGSTEGNNGIKEWRWYNSTGLNNSEFKDHREDRFLSFGQTSQEETFAVGEYRIALRVADTCGASDWTNFTLEIRPNLVSLYTFGDGNLGDEWSTTGLWRVADECEGVGGDAPWLAYNGYDPDDALSSEDCDYDDGTANSGYAKVVTFDPSKSASSEEKSWYRFGIDFGHYFDVATTDLTDEDRMIFEASFDGGETWVGSEHTDIGCGGDDDDKGKNCWDDDSDSPGWDTQTNVFDLREQDYDGGEVLFRWMFNTTSTHDNDNKGWFIDDIEIYGLVENEPPTGGEIDIGCGVYLEDDAPDAPEGHSFGCSADVEGAGDADGSISEYRYAWDDGTSSVVEDPTNSEYHQYPTKTGTYTPEMIVTDDGMATATSTDALAEFIYWDQDNDDWDDDGLWDAEVDDGVNDCGLDALSGDVWMAMMDYNGCEYSSVDRSDNLELGGTIDTSRFVSWKMEFMTQHELACGDRVDLQIRLDGNDDWNTTNEHLDCDTNDGLDDDWDTRLDLDDHDADEFETLDGDGNWIETSRFPDDLEVRLAATGDGGEGTGAFVDDIVFSGFSH